MVVKDKIGRRRYVIMHNVNDLPILLRKISRKFNINLQFILKTEHYSVVRIKHWDRDKFISILKDFNIPTVKITGTIKKAKEIVRNRELGNK